MNRPVTLGWLDFLGIFLWVIGITFETGGDFQMARFKANPENRGKVLDYRFWRYTRHPNYFGDTTVWWGYALFFNGRRKLYWPVLGSLLMTALIIKISGVALLEKTLRSTKPQYAEYVRKTRAFIPWFPKKIIKRYTMIGKIQRENIWFILFIIWGIPLTIYRSKFRKMVYQINTVDH